MTTIQVPLDKNPDVAALVADMQMGDRVCGCFTIKSKDAQTLELRIEEMAATPDELSKGDEDEDKEEEETEATDESVGGDVKTPPPEGGRGRAMADLMNGGGGDQGY